MMGEGLRVEITHDGDRDEVLDMAHTPSRERGNLAEWTAVQQRFPSSKAKIDDLFVLWLSIPDSQKLVRQNSAELANWPKLELNVC